MFFESTYIPSPLLPNEKLLDSTISDFPSPDKEQQTLPDLNSIEETPVNHLVFIIHGIGQQTEQNGYFYENIKNLQETTHQVLQTKMADRDVRIELVPIEWHQHIHDQVDPTMNRITLKTIPTIRFIENDYLADVLYYFTKDRGQSIIDNVTQLFNTSYRNFMEKHPGFSGKIVILGYSLGGVLIWDILSNQRKPSTTQEEVDYGKSDIVFGKLDFKPNYFFSLGSPIAAVLTIRNQSPVTYHPDHDIVFENVFHPFDPLAYRMEPLFDDYYTYQPAIIIERSIPLGPSFSFPSLPSFSSIDLSSFFSWKTSSAGNGTTYNDGNLKPGAAPITHNATTSIIHDNNNSMSTYDTTYKMNSKPLLSLSLSKNNISAHHHSCNDLVQQSHHHNASANGLENGYPLKKGIMHLFLKYFGKLKRHGDKDINHSTADDYNAKNSPTVTTTVSITPDINEDPAHQMAYPNSVAHGVITWNPLQEQRQAASSTDRKSQGPLWKTLMETSDLEKEGNESSISNSNTNINDRDTTTHLTRSISSMSSSTTTLSSTTIIPGRDALQGSKMECVQTNSADKSISKRKQTKNSIITNDRNKQLDDTTSFGAENKKKEGPPTTYLQHLVNVLGLDSMGIESFEREQLNISQTSNTSNLKQLPLDKDKNMDLTVPRCMMIVEQNQQQRQQGLGIVQKDVATYRHIEYATTTPVKDIIMEATNNKNEDNDDKIDQHQELEAEKLTAPMSIDDDTNSNTRTQQQQQQQNALKYLPRHRRVDFSLQPDSLMSMIANEYIVGLRAHFSYWTSKDLMWHILQALEK